MDQLVLAHAVQNFFTHLHRYIGNDYQHLYSSVWLGMLTVLDIDNLQISLASVSCQYPELTINTILERIWKTKCDLFRLKFDAIIVKFVAMQI